MFPMARNITSISSLVNSIFVEHGSKVVTLLLGISIEWPINGTRPSCVTLRFSIWEREVGRFPFMMGIALR